MGEEQGKTLRKQLAEAEAQAAHLRNRIGAESCVVAGHDWRHVGGRNASCDDPYGCTCSVPVYECTVCGDSDYGDNAEARQTIKACQDEDRLRADEAWFFDMDGKP